MSGVLAWLRYIMVYRKCQIKQILGKRKQQSENVLVSEMRIPIPVGQTVGEIVISLLILFFVLLAIFNLVLFNDIPVIGLLASASCLVLMLLCVWGLCKYNGGARHSLIRLMSFFSRYQFAAVCQQAEGWDALCFGYRFFGRRFYLLKIKCDGIQTVDWNWGQLSDRTGRDANDWHVIVWYNKRLATKRGWDSFDEHDLGLYIVGPEQEKNKAEELGNRFIEFLRDADVTAAKNNLPSPELLEEMSVVISNKKLSLDGYGEFYYSSTKGYLKTGTKVRGIERRGLSFYVEPIEPDSMSNSQFES